MRKSFRMVVDVPKSQIQLRELFGSLLPLESRHPLE